MRMLTGISETGTEHEDPISFSSELALGTNSPTIELRNDADPTQEPVMYAPPPLHLHPHLSPRTPTSGVAPQHLAPQHPPHAHTPHTPHSTRPVEEMKNPGAGGCCYARRGGVQVGVPSYGPC